MRKIIPKKRSPARWLAGLFCFLLLWTLLPALKGNAWVGVTEGISFDPETKEIVFTTVDKEKVVDIYYKTFGFTFADATAEGETGLGEFEIPLAGVAVGDPEDLGGGLIRTTWRIPYSIVLEKIRETSQAWYDKVVYPQEVVYLKVDAIIAIHNKAKYPERAGWSGTYDDEFGKDGLLWDKYTRAELDTAEGWSSPQLFDNHFDQYLIIAMGEPDVPPPVIVEPPTERYDLGKDTPEFYTYNYSTDGRFEIGDGIPTSERVTNGYEADEWYGHASVVKTPASKSYTFHGNIVYEYFVTVTQEIPDPNNPGETIEVEMQVPFTKSEATSAIVHRQVKFWNLTSAYFYDLYRVTTENQIDPLGMPNGYIRYFSNINTNFNITVNGVNLNDVVSIGYAPDLNYHVDWPVVENYLISAGGDGFSRKEALDAFNRIAENSVTPSKDIYVRNDNIMINGKAYMSANKYRYSEFKENKGYWNSYLDIPENDYGLEKDEEPIIIPSTVPNGEYPTSITVNYQQMCVNNNTMIEKEKNPTNSTIPERILLGYHHNEPVVVHTPTIAPVEIIDRETGDRLEIEDTPLQLVPGAINPDVNYQLLLDGTYTIKFVPEEHFEHIGYPDMAESLYNKYCKFKQVAFPFEVQLDGDIYHPDDSTVAANGEPKKPGYTQWIYLNDFSINDFYIPSWAIEGNDYVTLFRVAPENVEDMFGVNHIDDEEWLKNATLNGEPLYNYVSTYSINMQVSGRIYDFMAVGINDRDIFEGFNNGRSHGMGTIQDYPFCPTYQEKRSGTKNRLGGNIVRYSLDGTLTSNWNTRNTLPFSTGKSLANGAEGTLRKNNTFAFTVKTIANLYDELGDMVRIRPTMRWVSEDGTQTLEHEELNIYYTKYTETNANLFTQYGSARDTKEGNKTSIANNKFQGSYYSEDLSLARTIPQDDGEFSKDHANAWLYNWNIQSNSSWPREAYPNTNTYLRKEVECYSLSDIILTSELRLLNGNLELLERNLDKQGAGLEKLRDCDDAGNYYDVDENTNPELWYKHRESMQLWFGEYWIPNQLLVTTRDIDLDDYDYLDGSEDFWIRDGYLVLNFDIITINNEQEHLSYHGGNHDQWQVEGPPTKVKTGDPELDEEIEIIIRSGDVAVIDLDTSTNDRYEVGINYISG